MCAILELNLTVNYVKECYNREEGWYLVLKRRALKDTVWLNTQKVYIQFNYIYSSLAFLAFKYKIYDVCGYFRK